MNLMKMIKRDLVAIAALFLIPFVSIHADAGTGVKVEKISESALDELINAKNNILMVTFMAAWCGPCIDELPALNRLYNKYKDKGLNLIGISIDMQGPQAMQPIISKLQISFPIYWYGEPAVRKFSLFAIPMIFLVKEGRVVEKLPGRRSEKELGKKIRVFLSE